MVKGLFYRAVGSLFLLISIQNYSFSQTDYSNEVFNIVFKHNYENNTTGAYNDGEFNADWNTPAWSNRNVPPEIVYDPAGSLSGEKYMRWHFPAGGVGPEEGGGQWLTYVQDGYDELYLSYNLRFKPGFEWVLSGKLPGLRGGPLWSGFGPPPWDGGFSAMLAWTRDAKIMFYYYHQNQIHEYGDASTWNYTFETGKWYNISIRIVLNTIGENGGNNDGIMEGYVNGALVSQALGVNLRNINTIHVDQIFMCSSYGGDGDIYAPSSDQYLDVDDFVVFTYQNGVNVTRGNVANPYGTQLNVPFTSQFNSSWQNSIKVNAVAGNKIVVNWADYSIPGTYNLERRKSDESAFTAIAQLNYGSTSYTDETVSPLSGYYYRISCNGLYSIEVYTETPNLNIPAVPGNLHQTAVEYRKVTIAWSDNSSNENGFEVWRRTSAESGFSKLLSADANVSAFEDLTVQSGVQYFYQVRAFNSDGFSAFSNTLEVTTPLLLPPSAPTMLKSLEVTDESISVSWNDNSTNEKGFIITRSLSAEPAVYQTIVINANDTSYTDTDLPAATTYTYQVKAINEAGNSPASNKNVVTTLSTAETKRVKDGLIAYYNFGYNTDHIIYDQSGYDEPVNLRVLNLSAISWNQNHKLDILSNTALVSLSPAKKITKALKKTNEVTVECWIKPVEPDFGLKSRIISLSNSDSEIGFVLDQDLSEIMNSKNMVYAVRMQTESTNPSGFPEYIPDQSISHLSLVHISYVRDSLGRECVYLNGEKSSEGFRPSDLNSWDENFYLRLGNESDLNHSWKGSYYAVAIYNQALSQNQIRNNYSAGPCDSLKYSGIEYEINVYPNPISDLATLSIKPVKIEDDLPPQTNIRILDVYGKVFYQEYLFNPYQEVTRTIDFGKDAPGIYLLHVVSGSTSNAAKLVVQ